MDEILNLVESVSEGFPSYSCKWQLQHRSLYLSQKYGENRISDLNTSSCGSSL